MIYAGKRFTATVTGRKIVQVRCEKCQTAFLYELTRQGHGAGSAPYYIGQEGAQKRAMAAANKDLAKRLAREADLVACPKCHWVNDALIRGYRRTRFKALAVLGVVAGLAVWIIGFVFLYGDGPHARDPNVFYLTGASLSLLAGVLVGGCFFGLRTLLRKRINPNRTYPAAPKLPPATPKAWTAEELNAPPVPPSNRFEPSEDIAEFSGWAVFRAGHLVVPPVCCECLAPATTQYRSPFTVNDKGTFHSPLCAECASRIRMKWWSTGMLTAAAVAIGAGAVYLLASGDTFGRGMLAVLFAIFGLAFGLAIIPTRLTTPYKFKVVDRARGIFRVKFESEQFTEMVKKACSDHERATFRPPAPPG